MSVSSRLSVHSQRVKIDSTGQDISVVTFTENGEYVVGGGREGIRVWRAQDGKEMTLMKMEGVYCLAVSKDCRWIAAGTNWGGVVVKDAQKYEQVFGHKEPAHVICGVDFSPDSKRLVASWKGTAAIWEVPAGRRIRTLDHDGLWVCAAKYSPQGDRIAVATSKSIRIWGGNDGRMLVEIAVRVTPYYNTGLLWSDNHLFVISDDHKIKKIDASTGSVVSNCPVPVADPTSCIALPRHGKFIAFSGRDSVTFWDVSTHRQLCLVHRYRGEHSVAFSPDDRSLAFVTRDEKITVKPLSHLIEPDIAIEDAALESWKHDKLADTEKLLTAATQKSKNTAHDVLASRALVRTRLQQWDAAISDVHESLKVKPSIIGYIAQFVALVSMGKKLKGYRTCDIALEHFHSAHVTIILLIKAVVAFMAGEHEDAIARMDNLISAVYFNSAFYVIQAYMFFLLGNLDMKSGDYGRATQLFEQARTKLGDRTDQPPLIVSLITGWKFDDLAVKTQQRLCEALLACGRTKEANECLLRMVIQEPNLTVPTLGLICDLMQRSLSTRESTSRNKNAPISQEMSDSYTLLLTEWAKLKLKSGSWKDALAASGSFVLPRFVIYRAICERLVANDCLTDAVACFNQLNTKAEQKVEIEQKNWIVDFKSRCVGKLESLGDAAMNDKQYGGAVSHYTAALSLNPTAPQDLLVKRSKAHAAKRWWTAALKDANGAIKLDPSSPSGYERKYAALLGKNNHDEALDAYKELLSKISQSSDPLIQARARQYVAPTETQKTIREIVQNVIRESPLVLINTTSGRLCNKLEQATAFEQMPAFTKLMSSMATKMDRAQIQKVVREYYRYATLSHKWEENEPLFEKVTKVVVYDLEASPTHEKLKRFCKIVREAGFNWAWSDTCCINQGDHFVLQEALVSMFKWYQGSAMTVVFLLGVGRLAQQGALTRSIWNTRAWTLQEYHASKVVRFYTEDWTPYLDLDIHNHKDSPVIIAEMQEATGISAEALTALRPGLDDIREKLCLASKRQAMRVEDTAYSLLGIFSMSLPVIYGEGDRALGRLLAQLLTSSGDESIFAWTGRSGSFNSCLPANVLVFHKPATSHIPLLPTDVQMAAITTSLRASSLDITLITELYDKLDAFPVPSFGDQRLRLPCLAFELGKVSAFRNGSKRGFRARTAELGTVEITTNEDLSQFSSLCLVHPWIDFLLGRYPVRSVAQIVSEDTNGSPSTPASSKVKPAAPKRGATPRLGRPSIASLQPPTTMSPIEKQSRALELVARLRQPFGALLLVQQISANAYKRVVSGTSITVQVEDITPAVLGKLVQSARTLDVL